MDRLGLSPVAVANNALLKEVARLAPADLGALATVPGIRNWQIRDFGEELLEIVSDISSNSQAPTAPAARKRRRRRKKPEDVD